MRTTWLVRAVETRTGWGPDSRTDQWARVQMSRVRVWTRTWLKHTRRITEAGDKYKHHCIKSTPKGKNVCKSNQSTNYKLRWSAAPCIELCNRNVATFLRDVKRKAWVAGPELAFPIWLLKVMHPREKCADVGHRDTEWILELSLSLTRQKASTDLLKISLNSYSRTVLDLEMGFLSKTMGKKSVNNLCRSMYKMHKERKAELWDTWTWRNATSVSGKWSSPDLWEAPEKWSSSDFFSWPGLLLLD